MSSNTTIPLVLSDSVDIDLLCRKCAYNLRCLKLLGRCPECGTPVGLSVEGDRLRFAGPRWLCGIKRGIELILFGLIVVALSTVCRWDDSRGSLFWGVGLALLGNMLGVAGTWLITRPDPVGAGIDKDRALRITIRVAVVAALLGYVFWFYTDLRQHRGLTYEWLEVFAVTLAAVGEVLKLFYLGELAMRVPDQRLSQRSRWLCLFFMVYGVCKPATILVLLVGPWGLARMLRETEIGLIIDSAFIVISILYFSLLVRLLNVVKYQTEVANRIWAKAEIVAVLNESSPQCD